MSATDPPVTHSQDQENEAQHPHPHPHHHATDNVRIDDGSNGDNIVTNDAAENTAAFGDVAVIIDDIMDSDVNKASFSSFFPSMKFMKYDGGNSENGDAAGHYLTKFTMLLKRAYAAAHLHISPKDSNELFTVYASIEQPSIIGAMAYQPYSPKVKFDAQIQVRYLHLYQNGHIHSHLHLHLFCR